ncbi:MAG TPA: hypothetical protein VEI73_04700 [Candidatus Acidoferrum sp.]|nr:hypothetical protein [Candidatus Acidoferrum sp.]
MNFFAKLAGLGLPLLVAGFFCPSAEAQVPVPVIDTTVPIVIGVIKPKPKANGLVKFEGFVLNANTAQITARAKNDERSIQTFSLSQEASTKMQQIVDKGGYQWGDKVTVYYDPATMKAVKFKGKPSKPI